jgi:hypothetical protein
VAGIFGSPGGTLGYFAQPDRTPRFDLGPEQDLTPEGRESRQIYERGVAAMLDQARSSRSVSPLDEQRSPALERYQEAAMQLRHLDPAMADELVGTASQVAIMEQRRRGRSMIFSGLGYWVFPSPSPGSYLVEQARAGLAGRMVRSRR